MNEPQEAIPIDVLRALEEVRADGAYNMMERNSIIRYMLGLADGGGGASMEEAEYRQAISWLVDNPGRYMSAVVEMGNRRGTL